MHNELYSEPIVTRLEDERTRSNITVVVFLETKRAFDTAICSHVLHELH